MARAIRSAKRDGVVIHWRSDIATKRRLSADIGTRAVQILVWTKEDGGFSCTEPAFMPTPCLLAKTKKRGTAPKLGAVPSGP